jgi:hypothetical protein
VVALLQVNVPKSKVPEETVILLFIEILFETEETVTPVDGLITRLLKEVEDVPPIVWLAEPLNVTVLADEAVNVLLLVQFPEIFIEAEPVLVV